MWYLELQTFLTSLLKDESGANEVEYGLIIMSVAVFIIAAVILIPTTIANLLIAMASCVADVVDCASALF